MVKRAGKLAGAFFRFANGHHSSGMRAARSGPSTTQPAIWRCCGNPRCSCGCRDQWAWKRSLCLTRSLRDLPATHFLTLRPGPALVGDAAFTKATTRFFALLRKRSSALEYLVMNEWKNGTRHAHALVRASGRLSRRVVRDVKRRAGVPVSVKPVRNQIGAEPDRCGPVRLQEHQALVPEGGTAAHNVRPSAPVPGFDRVLRETLRGAVARHPGGALEGVMARVGAECARCSPSDIGCKGATGPRWPAPR